MKKLIAIIFAISLIAPSPAQADAVCDESCQIQKVSNQNKNNSQLLNKQYEESSLKINLDFKNELQNIDKIFLPKETIAKLNFDNALAKWREIDQIKVTNDNLWQPYCQSNNINPCRFDVTFFNSRFTYDGANGVAKLTFSTQDQNRSPGVVGKVMGKVISGTNLCCAQPGISGGRDTVYELIVPNYEKSYQEFNWDFEQEYSPILNWGIAGGTILAFQQGWMWSVKNDGTRVSLIEFNMIRNNVKNSYAELLIVQKQYSDSIKLTNEKFENLKILNDQNYKKQQSELLNSYQSEISLVKWVTESNRQLISNFPTTAKKELIKQGYFKPLKTFYWTCETGRYIASAEWLDQYTVAVGGYWETKTCKDVPTKKEQSTWIKKSEAKLAEYTKIYNGIIELAKLKNLVVQCVAKNPCKISFKKD